VIGAITIYNIFYVFISQNGCFGLV